MIAIRDQRPASRLEHANDFSLRLAAISSINEPQLARLPELPLVEQQHVSCQ
jgi:hypothetical protein